MAVRELTIALCQLDREAAGRWFIAKDMNCDGVFTIATMRQTLNARSAQGYGYGVWAVEHGVMASCVRVRS